MTRLQKYHSKDVPSKAPSMIDPPERTSRRSKPPARTKIRNKKPSAAKGWVITILLAIIISLALRIFVFEIPQVDGDSMVPTLNSEQRIVVDKVSRYFNSFSRGQIVVVKYPNMPDYHIRRLIGLPGDILEIKHNVIYVNGSPLQENYLPAGQTVADMAQITVPVGTIFVIGDNRPNSLDSRSPMIGSISTDNLLGNALFVIWPFNEIQALL